MTLPLHTLSSTAGVHLSGAALALMLPVWYHLLKLPMSGLQTKPEKKYLDQYGLDLINGAVINNVEAGVLEPALAKTKIIQVMPEEQHAANFESRPALACLPVTEKCAAASELTRGLLNCCSLRLRLQSLS